LDQSEARRKGTTRDAIRSEAPQGGAGDTQGGRPLVSIVLPAFNEAAIFEQNLETLCVYLKTLEDRYRFEIVVVNDGSTDATGELADAAARRWHNVRVLHHPTNFGLGQALKFGFRNSRGDYIVVMDIDLSYSPDHIERLLAKIRETKAKVVLASPYVEGGTIASVPWLRRVLSIGANRFLSQFARDRFRTLVPRGRLSTLTGMVRAYDGRFLRGLSPRSISMEINPEIVYKAMLLRARIEEVPARLDWELQNAKRGKRRSSMRILAQTLSVLLSGFIFRPFMFFILPGAAMLLFSMYCNAWMFIHFFRQYDRLRQYDWFMDRASFAVAAAYEQFPHTFTVGLLSLMLAIQLIGLGIMAMQNKKYFDEIFYLVSVVYRQGLESDGPAD
jgi:glycosyltransferase involved in cell wall biosynthesis